MRSYATIRPTFWTRGSGKRLRGDRDAQVLALYLMSSPHSNQIGLYHVALPTIAHEVGMSVEAVRETLARVSEIARYDEEAELVWLPNAAREQMQLTGMLITPKDKRLKAVLRELEAFDNHPFALEFRRIYLGETVEIVEPLRSPFEAPSAVVPLPAEGASAKSGCPPVPAPAPAPVPVPDGGVGEPRPEPHSEPRPELRPDTTSDPWRVRAPSSLDEALSWPLEHRARACLDFDGEWACPQQWPEVVGVHEALARAMRRPPGRLGSIRRDSGVKAVVGLYADGVTNSELLEAVDNAARDDWWRQGRKGLASLTPEVVRRLLEAGAPAEAETADEFLKREAERRREAANA